MRLLRALTLAVLVGVIGSAVLATPSPAPADPATDLSTEAAAILQQIQTTNQRITGLGQQYDAIQLRLQSAQDNLAADQAAMTPINDHINQLKSIVATRAASDYRAESTGQALHALDSQNAEQLSVRNQYAAHQAAVDNATLAKLSDEQGALARKKADAQEAQANAQADTRTLDDVRQQLTAAMTKQTQTLNEVQGALAVLLPTREQERSAADLAAALAQYAPGTIDHGDPSLYPNLPPVSPTAGVAIAFALAQLGKPYLYAAAGPNSFDCSGLVMAAFAFAGFQLPHYSGAQYAMLPHIPFVAMQPGDLLFWGPAASEHVAIYVGAGRILEAGGTGNIVHIGPIWGHPIGAARVPG
jgi:cell wall-associated NlpC family hydrolase